MPAYWVARSKINDPVEYKKYTDLVPGIIAKFGGKVLARGGRHQMMEGPAKFQRFVVIEFPSFEQGVACFTSPEYDRAAAFRRNGAGEVETVIVEGGDTLLRGHEVRSSLRGDTRDEIDDGCFRWSVAPRLQNVCLRYRGFGPQRPNQRREQS